MLRLTHSADLRKKNRGFTLIELIVVIVIIGILAAIAIVGYNAIIANSKKKALNASATQIAKILQGESASDQNTVNSVVVSSPGTTGATGVSNMTFKTGSNALSATAQADVVSALNVNTLYGTATTAVVRDSLGNTCTITYATTVGATNAVVCS